MPVNALPIAFSTLAFPDATLAEATSLGRSWGYAGVELRLIDGQPIDSSMPASERVRVKQTIAAARLPIVAVDSMILLTADEAGPELRRFLELANDWESPLIRVYGGPLAEEPRARRTQIEAAAGVLQEAVPLAERLGVAVAIETHDAFSASSVVAELLAMVDSRWIGALWDTHHPHRMEKVRPRFTSTSVRGSCTCKSRMPDAQRSTKVVGNSCCWARERYRSER
jgi:sugar phosphate isomerase/epimerase